MRLLVPLTLLGACDLPADVHDEPLPTDGSQPLVGRPPLQFHGRTPKNLIFLSIDTFRKDNLGRYGGHGTAPFIDKIATQGVTLDNHLQCSNWTFGSTTCTIAGRYNTERGHMPRLNGTALNRPEVPDGTRFLATFLQDAGFYSVIVSANDWLSANWGNTQGYDEVLKPAGPAPQVLDAGSKAIRDAIDRGEAPRWFMHLHFMEPHASYDPPVGNIVGLDEIEPWSEDLTDRPTHYKWRDEWPQLDPSQQAVLADNLWALYDGEIRTIDERLEDLWGELDREGYLDDTLVVIWNDHGEQFWEHGHQTHAFELTGEENDGIAVFWARNLVPARYTAPTSAIDLVPTVLEVLGVEQPPEVTGYVVGTAPADRPVFAEALARMGGINAVVRDGLKLQYFWNGRVTFYDRNTDPREQVDLYDPTDPRVLDLWSVLKPQAELMAPLVVDGLPHPNFPPELP